MESSLGIDTLYLIAEQIGDKKTFHSFAMCCRTTAEISRRLKEKKKKEFQSWLGKYIYSFNINPAEHHPSGYTTGWTRNIGHQMVRTIDITVGDHMYPQEWQGVWDELN